MEIRGESNKPPSDSVYLRDCLEKYGPRRRGQARGEVDVVLSKI